LVSDKFWFRNIAMQILILGEDDTTNCKCGEIQTMGLQCPLIRTTCDENDLHLANDKAAAVVAFWMTEI